MTPTATTVHAVDHLPLVYHVARKLIRTNDSLDMDDLVGDGAIGLIGACKNFDADRGFVFSTFAVPRIRGAMLDGMRSRDHAPRSLRRKAKALKNGTAGENRDKWLLDIQAARRRTFDVVGDHGRTLEETLDNGAMGQDEAFQRENEIAELRHAVQELPEQMRTVISLYYFEEMKLHEIGALLNLTESRISQVKTKAISQLRGTLFLRGLGHPEEGTP